MIKKIFKTLDNYKLKAISYKLDRGMTYVELIVVLSIFSIMTSVILFDYGNFQARVDIKVLANDIALKIIEAQKNSVSGKWNTGAADDWKPSYGVYFDRVNNQKSFISFVNITGDDYSGSNNTIKCLGNECLDFINITKGNYIKDLKCSNLSINTLDIVFRRPDSTAIIPCAGDVDITISSSGTNPVTADIVVSPSGRIQIK